MLLFAGRYARPGADVQPTGGQYAVAFARCPDCAGARHCGSQHLADAICGDADAVCCHAGARTGADIRGCRPIQQRLLVRSAHNDSRSVAGACCPDLMPVQS